MPKFNEWSYLSANLNGSERPEAVVASGEKRTFNVKVTGAARPYRAASVWTAGLGIGSPSNLAFLIQCGDSCALHGNWLPPYEDRAHNLGNVRLVLTEHVLYNLFEGTE